MLIIAALMLFGQDKPYEGELKERLRAPAVAVFESAKRSYDLEICVADILTAIGTPIVLRDGPDDIVVAASFREANAYLTSISIIRTETGSRLELRLRGKALIETLRARMAACL